MQVSCLSIAQTHPGLVRTLNEDAFIERPDIGLWAVADGMGGHEAGDVASRLVIDMLADLPVYPDYNDRVKAVTECLSIANQRLRQIANSSTGKIIGCTAVVLIIDNDSGTYSVLWVGDSRLYQMQSNQLKQITIDHTEVNEMIAKGYIDISQVETHPAANVVTRAVGAEQSLAIDRIDGTTSPDDLFLLCSDGLNKELNSREIENLLSTENLIDSSKALMHSALLRKARDNVTLIIIHVTKDEEPHSLEDTTVQMKIRRYK